MIARLLRTIGDFIPLASVALGVVLVIGLIHRTTSALSEVMSFHHTAESEVARALADELAHMIVSQSRGASHHESILIRNGYECRATLSTQEQGGVIDLTVKREGGRTHYYTSSVLLGAAPRALGVRLSLCESARDRVMDIGSRSLEGGAEPTWLSAECFPKIEIGEAPDVDHGAYGISQSDSVALLRLPSGTDARDYTFATDLACKVRLHVPARGVLRIKGNLWVDESGPDIQIELHRSLTIVVQGNIYLGRSLRVRGGGRLILVAQQTGANFIDHNLDGRWAAGEGIGFAARGDGRIEGSGALYVGLPSRPALTSRLHCDASIVCQGEAYFLAEAARFCGSLALAGGWLQYRHLADLSFSGEQVGMVQRVLIPGFAVNGAARPALLRER